MAQNLLICHFCEISNEIKWKCLNCDLNLCEDCKTRKHSRIKGSDNHTFINLRQIGTLECDDKIRQLDLENIMCALHDSEKCSLYCNDCFQPVCSLCVLESRHLSHKIAKLKQVYNDNLNELKALKTCIQAELSFYENVDISKEKYNEIKLQIQQRETIIKEMVSLRVERLLEHLDNLATPCINMKEGQNLRKGKDALKQRILAIESSLKSHSAESIMETVKQERGQFRDIIVNKFQTIENLEFTVTRDPIINFGELRKRYPILNINTTYKIDISPIQNFKFLPKNEHIMIYHDNNLWKRRKYQNEHFSRENSFGISDCETVYERRLMTSVVDMSATQDGVILLTAENDSNIYSLFDDGKIKVFTNMKRRRPTGIHATREAVIVGFTKIDYNASGIYKLIFNNEGGVAIHAFETNSNNQPLFTLPLNITTNINDEICVIDRQSKYNRKGRIMVLESRGQVKWIYCGHTSINCEYEFTPSDIVTTNTGLVIVSDTLSHAIHVLSMSGVFLSHISKEQCVYLPGCLDIDNDGNLHVFCAFNCIFPTSNRSTKVLVFEISDREMLCSEEL